MKHKESRFNLPSYGQTKVFSVHSGPKECGANSAHSIFDNSEYVTTKGAAEFLSRLLGKRFSPGAIRQRAYRKQIRAIKPFGVRGESFYSVKELRFVFTSNQTGGRKWL